LTFGSARYGDVRLSFAVRARPFLNDFKAHCLGRNMQTTQLADKRQRERHVEDLQIQGIDMKMERLAKQRESIQANKAARDEEDDERREARFERNLLRDAKKLVRFRLTDERRSRVARTRPIYVLWNYLYTRWKRKGSPPEGVEVTEKQMRTHLVKHCSKATRADCEGFTYRYVRKLIWDMRFWQTLEVTKHGQRPRSYLPMLQHFLSRSDRN
jgi:hypothetical protein